MKYKKCLTISNNENNIINEYLKYGGQDEDYTIINTAKFDNNIEMDIKCCGSQDESSWTEAVLFDENGYEIAYTEPSDEYVGTWIINNNDDSYIVEIKVDI